MRQSLRIILQIVTVIESDLLWNYRSNGVVQQLKIDAPKGTSAMEGLIEQYMVSSCSCESFTSAIQGHQGFAYVSTEAPKGEFGTLLY